MLTSVPVVSTRRRSGKKKKFTFKCVVAWAEGLPQNSRMCDDVEFYIEPICSSASMATLS